MLLARLRPDRRLLRRARRHARSWRRSRPFWGGVCTVLAGAELLSVPFSSRGLFIAIHSAGAGIAYLLSITLILLGVVIWLQPAQRVFLGVTAVLLSATSVVYVNVGGFLLGAFLGLLGGATTAAWAPGPVRPAAVPAGGPAEGGRADEEKVSSR
ncbi:DUF6114 domain-containing protein [Sphaerisporangium aureirubrum]|uniref:DUF6114 domain-containing protein n=1 Tax=Sphaerisporangium aureirubrum TaxID=1544736 RepID=A0ABW1NEC0_9ACTN